jgi:DNA-binding NarL/FixJ family response regulator
MAGDADRDDRAAHLYAALVRAGVVGRFATAPQTVRVPRQRGAVLALIAEGYSNSEIADALSLSLQTVKGHTRNLMDSFGVATRVEVVIEATRQGILPALPAPRTRR